MASPSHNPAGTPSPVDHETPTESSEAPPVGAAATSRPTLVGDGGDAVAFLDAPGLGAQELLAAVVRVLASMSDGAILTVFTDDPTAPHMAADWSAGRRIELLAVIPHSDRDGTSLTFRRAEPESGSAATGLTQF
jgi:TusA-related sulfurtransferase